MKSNKLNFNLLNYKMACVRVFVEASGITSPGEWMNRQGSPL